MKPYQRQIISHFKKTQDHETKVAYDLPIDQAVQQLGKKLGDPNTPEIEQRMNQILKCLIQSETAQEHSPLKAGVEISGANTGLKLSKKNDQSNSEKSSNLKMQPDEPPTKKKNHRTSPFDFFGINPQFFMNNQVKTMTWLGFFFTLALLGVGLSVLIMYLKAYSSKESATISSLSFLSDEHARVDLKEFD